jgi:hypothetical protein
MRHCRLLGYKVRSLTYDNGLEFANHLEISQQLGGFKLLAHKTSKEVVSGLTPQLDDLGRALDKRIQGVCEGVH